jgi:cell division protein FtsI/penicillin-binding protein 2
VLGPRPGGERVLSEFTAAAVTASLERAVREGTGAAAAVVGGVAGKTGTAETGRTGAGGAPLYHGWFAGFWPARGARFVMVVLIEDTPVGGAEAARVFGEILVRLAGGG